MVSESFIGVNYDTACIPYCLRPEQCSTRKEWNEECYLGALCRELLGLHLNIQYSETWRRKPSHSAESPALEAGIAMGLAEADWGLGAGMREARRVLTSSSRISASEGDRGSIEMSVWVRSSSQIEPETTGKCNNRMIYWQKREHILKSKWQVRNLELETVQWVLAECWCLYFRCRIVGVQEPEIFCWRVAGRSAGVQKVSIHR